MEKAEKQARWTWRGEGWGKRRKRMCRGRRQVKGCEPKAQVLTQRQRGWGGKHPADLLLPCCSPSLTSPTGPSRGQAASRPGTDLCTSLSPSLPYTGSISLTLKPLSPCPALHPSPVSAAAGRETPTSQPQGHEALAETAELTSGF